MAFLISSPEISSKIFFNPNPNPISRNHKNLTNLRYHEKIGSRTRVRVSGLEKDVRLYGQFSAPVKRSKEEEEKQNYYVNMGYAIQGFERGFSSCLL
ncbi:hypothetical protein Ddye_017669 [Dipteronia dyeriana]|uniref:Uncharacterized protein n=1 Tax=Dipteronia dyeriana TaxID=168575 RepID=A0AAD9U939_9ROSI|nr:hypothetical protein Ddye_017669 [Dipteronia dyeriana]